MKTTLLLSLILLGSFALGPRPAAADPDQNNAPVAAKVPASPGCLQSTDKGPAQKTTPCATFGRSYTGEDLKQTGRTSVGDALAMLDPAITVHK